MSVSELQKAADRVREIQAAIDEFEAAKVVCEQAVLDANNAVTQAQLKLREEQRNLYDTRSFLNAQYEKRGREIAEMRQLTYDVDGLYNQATEERKY
jgi:hypothetical protein